MGTHPIFESDFDCLTAMSVGDDIIRMNIDGKAYAWRPTSDDLIARERIAAAVPGTPTLAAAAGAGALMLGGPAFFLLRNKGFVKFVFSVPMGWIGGSMTALLAAQKAQIDAYKKGMFDTLPACYTTDFMKLTIEGSISPMENIELLKKYGYPDDSSPIDAPYGQAPPSNQITEAVATELQKQIDIPSASDQLSSMSKPKKYNKYGDEIVEE